MLMLAPQIIGTPLFVQALEGVDVLVKRKTWPKGKGFKSRVEVMQKLYDEKNLKNPQVKTLSLLTRSSSISFWLGTLCQGKSSLNR